MNIGIVLPDLGLNQTAFEAITSINKSLDGGSKNNYVLFYENLSPVCVRPLCGTMNISHVWGFTGILISTSLHNSSLIMNAGIQALKVFYVADLEFLHGHTNFIANINVYRNPLLRLVTRSEEYGIALDNYANRSIDYVIPTLDVETIYHGYKDYVPKNDYRNLKYGVKWQEYMNGA